MVNYLTERHTLRPDQTLTAISNPPQETKRHPRELHEESSRRAAQQGDDAKIKYEQDQGWELFVYKRRLFWATATDAWRSSLFPVSAATQDPSRRC
jgi:hypothetical protein